MTYTLLPHFNEAGTGLFVLEDQYLIAMAVGTSTWWVATLSVLTRVRPFEFW